MWRVTFLCPDVYYVTVQPGTKTLMSLDIDTLPSLVTFELILSCNLRFSSPVCPELLLQEVCGYSVLAKTLLVKPAHL